MGDKPSLIVASLLGFVEALNERNLEAIGEHVGTRFQGPGGTMHLEGVREAVSRLWERLPDTRVEIVSLTTEGDRVAWEWRIRSSHLEIPLGGMSLSRIADGKVTVSSSYYDSEALRQDGVESLQPLPL